MSRHNIVGQMGEELVAQLLSQVGKVAPGDEADLNFEGVEIEVKTATPSNYNGAGARGYQFCLRRAGKTDVRKADVVVLICLNDDLAPRAAYVLPVDLLRCDRSKISVPFSLDTRLAPYRDRWDVIADAVLSQ
jgi:hypothetical protein